MSLLMISSQLTVWMRNCGILKMCKLVTFYAWNMFCTDTSTHILKER